MAELGLDIVLISRTKTKLEDVANDIRIRRPGKHREFSATAAELAVLTIPANERHTSVLPIEEKYKVQTKIIEAEFTDGFSVFQRIEKDLLGLEVGVLINNIGMSYPYPEYFLELDKKEKIFYDIVQCNIVTMLELCQIVMPGMVERKKGVVINISSTAADIPSPFLSVYGASKAFVSKFTKDLSAEYKKHGIVIQCLVPGYVATKMSKIKNATWMCPTPKTYVSKALQTTGVRRTTTGYVPHTILLNSIHLMESICPKLAEWMVMRSMLNIRARALKKLPQTIG